MLAAMRGICFALCQDQSFAAPAIEVPEIASPGKNAGVAFLLPLILLVWEAFSPRRNSNRSRGWGQWCHDTRHSQWAISVRRFLALDETVKLSSMVMFLLTWLDGFFLFLILGEPRGSRVS